MGMFSRLRDKKDDAEQSLGSFAVTARIKSAYFPSVRPKAAPERPAK